MFSTEMDKSKEACIDADFNRCSNRLVTRIEVIAAIANLNKVAPLYANK
jgi:hypothetical protein